MPQLTKNEPDAQDVYNICASIGEEYNHVVYFTTRYRADVVEVVAKSVPAPYTPDTPPTFVALEKHTVKQARSRVVVEFALAFDLWLQHDGGGATAARRGPPRTWDGRVETLRGRKKA